MMKRVLCFVVLSALFSLGLCATGSTGSTPSEKRPENLVTCPKNMVCFTAEEAHRINKKLIELNRDLEVMKIKRVKRIGFTLGCGVGYSVDNSDADVHCGLTYGVRF